MKKIFKIDCGLYPLGLLTILSGIGLHIERDMEVTIIHGKFGLLFILSYQFRLPYCLSVTSTLIGLGSNMYVEAQSAVNGL